MIRLIVGIASGLVLVTVPPFLSHIAPEKYRTVFGTLHQSSIGIGMLFAQSLSLVLARPKWWRLELVVAAAIGSGLLGIGLLVKGDEEDKVEIRESNEETALLDQRGRSALFKSGSGT